jgi:hypothetical protein
MQGISSGRPFPTQRKALLTGLCLTFALLAHLRATRALLRYRTLKPDAQVLGAMIMEGR